MLEDKIGRIKTESILSMTLITFICYMYFYKTWHLFSLNNEVSPVEDICVELDTRYIPICTYYCC